MAEESFVLVGKCSTLFDDSERALEVNNGGLLIPWWGDKSVMIDRFDGRGYMTDILDNDAPATGEEFMTEDEATIEKMCDFERYLDLQVDVHEMTIQLGDLEIKPIQAW